MADWRIAAGARVLEIGCGQGDTTAVLADAVGRDGRVVAVDLADATYGVPVSLGESAQRLAEGPLGDRIEAHKTRSEANVRTPYSREALRTMLQETGWAVESEPLVDAAELDDARWETAACLSDALPEAEELGRAPRLQTLLASQIDVLRRISERGESRPLPSYSVVAARSHDGTEAQTRQAAVDHQGRPGRRA